MSLSNLNLGSIKASLSRQYKTLKLKKKIAGILLFLNVLFLLLSLIAEGNLFFFFSVGAFIVNLIAIGLLYSGLLDIPIFALSRKIYPPDQRSEMMYGD